MVRLQACAFCPWTGRLLPSTTGRLVLGVLASALLSSSAASGRHPAPPADAGFLQASEERAALEAAEGRARELVDALARAGKGRSIEQAGALDELVDILWKVNAHPDRILPWAERAAALRYDLGGKDLAYARSLYSLARLLLALGREQEAFDGYQASLEIRRGLLDPEHPDIGAGLNALGTVAASMGDWQSAREQFERALVIFSRSGDRWSRAALVTHFNLARLLDLMGDHAAVRDHYESLLHETEGPSGTPPLLAVRSFSRISEMEARLGREAEARRAYGKALGLWRSIQEEPRAIESTGAIERANTATRLAAAARVVGAYDEAKRLFLHGIEIRERHRGVNHREVAWDLRRLADLLRESGDLVGSRDAIVRACTLLERTAALVECLQSQAAILREAGEAVGARAAIQQALDLAERIYDPDDPALSPVLEEQSRQSLSAGLRDHAARQALRAESIARAQSRRFASWLSPREALRYESVRRGGIDLALSTLEESPGEHVPAAVAAEQAWDAVIRSRGLVHEELIARHRLAAAAAASDSRIDVLVKRLERERSRLAHVVAGGPGPDDAGSFREKVRGLMKEQEATERTLAARSAAFRRHLLDRDLGWDEVRSALPSGSSLVAYVRYDRYRPEGGARSQSPAYLAFVLPAPGAEAKVVSLGSADAIEGLVARWREHVTTPSYRRLASGDRSSTGAAVRAGEALRRAVWDPIERRLGSARLVLVVADGAVHEVNLSALPAKDGRLLVEGDRIFHRLFSEKDLLRSREPRPGTGLFALGAPDLELPAAPAGCPGSRGVGRAPPRLMPLPSAREEVEEIVQVWRAGAAATHEDDPIVLLGPQASEWAFKTLAPGRRVVHLATHGLAGDDIGPPRPAREQDDDLQVSPFLASGLAFSEADACGDPGPLTMDGEDGIMLGEEILSLDLSGVEWVALSACSTGLGAIQARGGVLGMQTWFRAAGAATVISSLWDIEDDTTKRWMIALYEARLRGRSTAESVRLASLELIAEARELGIAPHPYGWGGLIATGDWR